MSKNKDMMRHLLILKNNIIKNSRTLPVEIKLATNQKDDAQKVKDYIYDRIGKH